MIIRKAENRDAKRIVEMLSQVLELHAEIRPDIFLSGTTKYNEEEIIKILNTENKLTYVAVGEDDIAVGYAMCILKNTFQNSNMNPFKILYIDDICVDWAARGQHIGTQLFEYVKQQAKALECYEITLNVWEGNSAAAAFYNNMGMKPKRTEMELIIGEKNGVK
ncbi:MAG: GNAT family N-acetyltransferase [Ruminococcaceae bacterium]|nr:GNAT family N-acetyltransferase [Oscillospiraceae bacterium]